MRKRLFAATFVALLAIPASAQKSDYLDVMTVKIRPEKGADFRAITKKIADVNRRLGGDIWLAAAVVYGDGPAYSFISMRENYAAVDTAYGAFMKAMNEGFGPAATEKIFADFESCILSSRSEIRRRRWDLSANQPTDEAGMLKMLAGARWISGMRVQVKPGKIPAYEANLQLLRSAVQKGAPERALLVSQTVMGGPAGTYYLSRVENSLAAFDSGQNVRELMGDDYDRYARGIEETVMNSESYMMRIVPEHSSVTKEVAAQAPDFWNPKPVAARAKPAASAKK